MAQGRINFQVGFNVDKSGLNTLKASLQELMSLKPIDLINSTDAVNDLQEIQTVATKMQEALNKSYNFKLDSYNVNTFNKELNSAGVNIDRLRNAMEKAGPKGEIVFRNFANAVTQSKLELKETYNLIDQMSKTLMNTIRWSIASSAINTVTGSIQKAWSFTKQLDSSLNDIRIVTEKSSDEMAQFAKHANNAAKELGTTTKQYTQSSLIYFQQGLSDEEVAARSEVTIKAANVTGQNAAQVSEQLTAIWNGYKVSAEEAELYIDKVAAVAAATAADLEELSSGMSKVASAANNMGVDIDQLNAMLATTISVTREAPEAVGTAFKTIFARISDIEAGLDSETTLGEYTAKMKEMGFSVLDSNNHLRDMGDVIEEIGSKWTSLSRETQTALAQTMAGTRQYNNLLALFDSWSMYEATIKTSMNAAGTLQKQQDIAMESLQKHFDKLTATAEDLYMSFFDSESFKDILDFLTKLVEILDDFVDTVGGGGVVLTTLSSLLLQLGSKQISQGISTMVTNFQNAHENAEKINTILANLKEFSFKGIDSTVDKIVEVREQLILLKKKGLLNDEDYNVMQDELQTLIEAANAASDVKATQEATDKRMQSDVALYRTKDSKGRLRDSEGRYAEEVVSLEEVFNEGDRLRELGNSAEEAALQNEKLKIYLDQLEESKRLFDSRFTEAVKQGGTMPADIEASAKKTRIEAFSEDYENKNNKIQQYIDLTSKAINETGMLTVEEKENVNASLEKLQAKMDAYKEAIQLEKKLTAELNALDDSDPNKTAAKKALTSAKRSTTRRKNAVTEAFSGAKTEGEKAKKIVANTNKAIKEEVKKGGAGIAAEAKKVGEKVQENLNKEFKKINAQQIIQNITNSIAAIGQLASSIMMLKNLGSIWSDNDMSIGDKWLQTITIVASTLPLIYNSLEVLNTAMGRNATLIDVINAKKSAKNALDAIDLKHAKDITAATWFQVAAKKAGVTADADGLKVLLAKTPAELKQLGLTEAQIAALIKQKAAQDAVNASMLSNPVMLTVAGLAALVTVTSAVINAQKAQAEQQIENNKEIINQTKTLMEEADKQQELYTKYIDLLATYKQTGTEKDNLEKATLDLANAYDIEINKLDLILERYDKIQAAITEQQYNKAKNAKDEAAMGLNAAKTNLELNAGKEIQLGQSNLVFSVGLSFTDKEKELNNELKKQLGKYWGWNPGAMGGGNTGAAILGANKLTADEWIEVYQSINNVLKTITTEEADGNELYFNLKKWLDDNKDEYEAYIQAVNDYDTRLTEFAQVSLEKVNQDLGINIEEIDNIETFKKYKARFIEEFKEIMSAEGVRDQYTDTEIEKMVDNTLGSFTHLEDEIENVTIFDELLNKLTYKKLLHKSQKKEDKKNVEEYLKKLEKEGRLKIAAGALSLFDDDITHILISDFDNAMSRYEAQLAYHAKAANLTDLLANAIIGGEELEDNEVFKQLKDLDIVDNLLENFTEKSSVEQLEVLGKIESQMSNLIDKWVTGDGKLEELNSELTDAEQNFLRIKASVAESQYPLAGLINALELVGDGFTLAANKVEEFKKIAPDLLKGSMVNADGSITLNQETISTIAQTYLTNEEYLTKKSEIEAKLSDETVSEEDKAKYTELLSELNSVYYYIKNINTLIAQTPLDPYRVLNQQINAITRTITKLEEAQEHLVGKALLDNLEAQCQELARANTLLQDRFNLFKEIEKNNINSQISSIITAGLNSQGLTNNDLFDINGAVNLETYAQLMEIAKTATASEKTTWDAFFNELDTYIEKYNDFIDGIADNKTTELAKQFEKFELGFQIELDKQQLTKDLESFWRDFNNYGFNEFKESLQKSLGATQAMFNIELSKFNALSSESLSLSELITAKQESLNALQENALTQKEEIAELEEFINSIYSTRIEYQQNIIDLIEKQIALNKLVFGENAYNKFNTLASNSLAYYSNATTYAKDAAIAAQNEVYKFTGDKTSERYKELVSKSIEATQAWGDAIEAETNAVVSYYESSVDRIFGAIEEAATGSNREDWERQMSWTSSTDERWLDEVEAIYQLRDVEREYDKVIEKATGAQKKQLQERKTAELAILEAKKSQGTLQKADVERAQKSLEIEQARMALEDARNNKTKMRLTRGADGTYGYQYVADDNVIREAQDKLDDLYEDLYTFDKERYRGALDEIAELWAEYAEKRKELGADGELDKEDLAILSGYTQELEKLSSVTGSTLENLKTDIQAAYGEGLTEAQMSEMVRANISATSTGIAEFANKILQSGIDGVIGSYEIELSTETQKVAGYFTEVKNELDPAKEGSFAAHLQSVQGSAQGIVDAFNKLATSDSMKDLKDALSDMKTSFDNLAKSIETCINKILKLMDYNALVADSSNIQDAVNKAYNDKGETTLNAGFLGTSYMKQEGIIAKDATGAEIMQAFHDNSVVFTDIAGEKHNSDMFFTSTNLPTFDKNNTDDRYWGETIYLALLPYIDEIRKNKYMQQGFKERMGDYGWNKFIKYANIQELKSGGYTGEWGSDGRLAVLHEKELVLNKDDTANVLQAVNIIRSIASTLGSLSNTRALSMMSGLGASVAAWELAKEMIIEQKVDITAEFPNATDKDEIMEAFDNLINLASQHAYKTTR